MADDKREQVNLENGQAGKQAPKLKAYKINEIDVPIIPAIPRRPWMTATHNFAYNCLPMNIANQLGWLLINPISFVAEWNGGESPSDLEIEVLNGDERYVGQTERFLSSHFGFGIFTFNVPYLFRTPPGYNLMVRGPANFLNAGVQALEGVVETDWLDATFTMNWRITIPHYAVNFQRGEPICMIMPVKRGETESFETEIVALKDDQEQYDRYNTWSKRRSQTLTEHDDAVSRNAPYGEYPSPERDYILGKNVQDSQRFKEHQTRLHLQHFNKDWLNDFWADEEEASDFDYED
jgi:hypothetical protein